MKFEYYRYKDVFEIAVGYIRDDWAGRTFKTYRHVLRMQIGYHEFSLFMAEDSDED